MKKSESIPDEEMDFEIVSFERGRRRLNLVVSRKKLLEKKKEEYLKSIEKGSIVKGVVESVRDFGIFVKLSDGVIGLVPKSQVAHTRVAKVDDLFRKGQEVEAKVIDLDVENGKVTLSIKELLPDPFEEYVKDKSVGSVVSGDVVRVRNNGFVVKLDDDVWGFVPIEEIFWSRRGRIRDVVKEGDRVELEVVEIDRKNRKITLSYKKAKGDPWENVEEKYPEGSVVEGRVVKILSSGVIVELEDGVSGFVPISELSWHYFERISEVVKERRRVKVKVLSIDKGNRRMRLSIKRAQPNPWDRAEKELDRGSIVKGKVIKEINSGYIVRINDYNVDAFLPSNHVEGELKKGEEIEAVVLRILDDRKSGKRMIISVKDLEEMRDINEYKKEVEKSKAVKKLGDLLKKEDDNG